MLASAGQGRLDALPAGDLAYVKLVGRLLSGGDPWGRATEDEVSEFFARSTRGARWPARTRCARGSAAARRALRTGSRRSPQAVRPRPDQMP